jgi:hypothetical protein
MEPKKSSFLSFLQKYAFVIVIVVLAVGIGVSLKLYFDAQSRLKVLGETSASAGDLAKEASLVIEKVKKHMVLPDEEPKVLSIANVDLLKKEQPFFQQAKNGDKLIVFSQKVILYSPSQDRIVDVAQIRMPAPSSEPTFMPTRAPTPLPLPTETPSPTPRARPTR